MTKEKELSEPSSCLNRAAPDELIFVLRGHDIAAPAAIRAWCEERILLQKNTRVDPQIAEALNLARRMDAILCAQALPERLRNAFRSIVQDAAERLLQGEISEAMYRELFAKFKAEVSALSA